MFKIGLVQLFLAFEQFSIIIQNKLLHGDNHERKLEDHVEIRIVESNKLNINFVGRKKQILIAQKLNKRFSHAFFST